MRTEKVRQMHTGRERERWVFRIRKWKYPAQCQRESELECSERKKERRICSQKERGDRVLREWNFAAQYEMEREL